MSQTFQDKVFVITGSTQGLGRELAKIALELGAKVVINGRNPEREKEALLPFTSFGNRAVFQAADVSLADQAEKLIASAIEHFGQLDVLINNGGMSAYGDLVDTDPKVIKEVIDSNITGSLMAAHFAIPHLQKTKGSIVFISSLAAIHGLGGYSLYSASKMAYIAACQSLRKELSAHGIHVGIMYLGFTKNDEAKKTLSPNGKLEKVPIRKGLPVSSQHDSAMLILNQIKNRKPAVVHSAIGKLNYIMNRMSQQLIHMVLLRAYKKQKQA